MELELFVKPYVSKKGVLRKRFPEKLASFTGKHLSWSIFLIKLQTFSTLRFY